MLRFLMLERKNQEANNMTPEDQLRKNMLEKLDIIIQLLEDLFILEASKTKLPKEEIRKILKINKNRIGVISKYMKS